MNENVSYDASEGANCKWKFSVWSTELFLYVVDLQNPQSGLVFYHCVREGVPGDSGPGEEGEFKLVCFRLGDLKTFFIVSDIVVCCLV